MALAPGTKFGPYEIRSPLGAGGMGEVYRAQDTRLDRTVAIKILPKEMSLDPVRKQRFEREAKTISGLNHPNICVLFDVGSQDGVDYLVMEYVEGESLAERLEKGALPLEQTLNYGAQIADALDKAHRAGIVHRDLKPGNIMLSANGAKLLDFGLAKPAAALVSEMTLTTSHPPSPVTQEGIVVGTVQYMSPEQIEGKEVDGRSDIFSLGAVLYEMLAGQRAFAGKSHLSVASAILEKEPPSITANKPLAPRSLDHIIRRCLAKDPDNRWQTARDVSLELRSIQLEAPAVLENHRTVVHPANKTRMALSTVGLLVVAVLFLWALSRTTTPLSQPTISSSILPPEGKEFDRWAPAAVSPDGKHVVFSAVLPGWAAQLYLRRLDSTVVKPLEGTRGAQNPFWSPDSKWIAFVAGGKLRKMSVDGGGPLVLCDSSQLRGASWSSSGTILFVPSPGSPILSVPDAGGTPVPVTQLDQSAGEVTHRWPVFLPDGKHFLFLVRGRENAIYAASLDSKERALVFKNDTNVVYVAPGYLLFVQNGVLMAQPFDAQRLKLKGTPIGVVDDVSVFGGQQHGLFSASENGILAVHSKLQALAQPVWVDFTGKNPQPLMEPATFGLFDMRVAPDGRKIAFGITEPKEGVDNIWVHDVATHQTTRLTFEKLIAQHPVWSPDSSQLLYATNRVGHPQIFRISVSGIGEAQNFFQSADEDVAETWSPDSQYVVFRRGSGNGTQDRRIWVLPLGREEKPYPLLPASHSQQWDAAISPDGKWLAYVSDESGEPETYVVPFPEARTKLRVSKNNGHRPHWSRDGHQLFYVGKEHSLNAASLRFTATGVEVSDIRVLFKLDIPEFEVSSDGNRFLVFKVVDNQEPATLTLISNWMDLLRR
jgi:eukaryotic-like serine/threonine-protein kinase